MSCLTASIVDTTRASREKPFKMSWLVSRETTPFRLQRCTTYERVVFLKTFELFRLLLGRSKEEERLRSVENLLKLVGSCAVWGKRTVPSSKPPCKGHRHHSQVVKQAYVRRLELLHLWRDAAKKMNVLAVREA